MTDGPECRDCHRPLRDPASIARGYGRKCAEDLGLIPPRRPRIARPDTTPADHIHPDQTAIPIQLTI